MGSEQSSSRRENKEPSVTPRDVQRALEHQRMIYEQKIKNLMNENKRTETTVTSPAASSRSDVYASTGQQQTSTAGIKKAYVASPAVSYSSLRAACQPQTRHEAPILAHEVTEKAAHQQQTPAFVERQRTPYNYNQNDLQSPTNSMSGSLYPNLGNAYSNSPQVNNNMASPLNQPFGTSLGAKVYTNSSYQNNPMAQSNTPLQPSAPPVETVLTNSRSRSQSRQRGGENEVNCVTCGQMYGERIYQCNQGHSSCEVCKTRQVACGACRLHLTDRRNFDLEKYIMERRVRCPNSRDGCQLFIKMSDMAIHEKECPFQALQCPSLASSCNWRGKLSQLAEHFKEMHPLHIQGEVDKEMFISNIINTSHTMHYIQIGPFNFLFHIKVSQPDARIYMAVQLIGTKHSAAKWDYEIHMYKKSEPRRKYQYIDRCSSASQSLQEIISSTRCAVIPQDYAKTFICGGTIAYKFYIKRDDPKANESTPGNTARDKSSGPHPRRNFKKFVKRY